jgi:uncharacterized OB-fold protein
MSLPVPVCTVCGTAAFPPRALCPRCASAQWRDEPVDAGVVEGVTCRDGTLIAAVRTPLGPLVVVRLVSAARSGDSVSVDLVRSVPTAFPR